MKPETVQHLLNLNRLFYQTFAVQFSATRQRLQPGVQAVLERLPTSSRLLDLGCGNGEAWRWLQQHGHQGYYIGLDFSPGLLTEAGEIGDRQGRFREADLGEANWEKDLLEIFSDPNSPLPAAEAKEQEGLFDVGLAFAVLHHLPGWDLRLQTLRKVHRLLAPGGQFIHSEWQFLNSPRLRERIQPWEAGGLDPEDVDPGDYLLDWRRGGQGLRYVHHFSLEELFSLAEASGFLVEETFHSDGENGRLGLYQVWRRRV